MADGGEFEQLNTKAFLVFIDTLWEETTRDRIKGILQVGKSDVRCELMADLHRLRNVIIHQSEKSKQEYVQRADFLPQIWTIDPDNVVITSKMLHTLMEQLNGIRVSIGKEN